MLPFGRLFSFLFGTANDEDLQNMKQDIQKLYDNQVDQANVLNDIISITNVSRGLINENIRKINEIIDTISFLNETIDSLAENLNHCISQEDSIFFTLRHKYTTSGSEL